MYMISHYCAGFITNWGVHHLDIAGWGCPEVFEKPFEIEGTGVLPTEGMTDTWISWQMELRWESGLQMSYSNSDNPNRLGCRFEGEEGWVHVEPGRHLGRTGLPADPATQATRHALARTVPNSPIRTRLTPPISFVRFARVRIRYRRSRPDRRRARWAMSPILPCGWDAS